MGPALTLIDPASGKARLSVPVGREPEGVKFSADGNLVYLTPEVASLVHAIDTADQSAIDTLRFEVKGARAADLTPVGIQMPRDGKRAFAAQGSTKPFHFVDVPTRNVTYLVRLGKRAWNVSLDNAATRLWVVNGLGDDVTLIDVAAAKPTKSIPVGRVPYGLVLVE